MRCALWAQQIQDVKERNLICTSAIGGHQVGCGKRYDFYSSTHVGRSAWQTVQFISLANIIPSLHMLLESMV